ncbi:MAG: hypothetical protein H0T62_06555 [Parachlamydiaceae bacterium]|nr:hypothetical protein [Parachlamydiaceae bacterium]
MNVTLITPARSDFINRVSAFIDEKLTTDDRIATLGSSMFKGEPLSHEEISGQDLSDREIILYDTLLKNLYRLPADPQSEILKSTRGFQSWVVSKMHCKDEAVDLYAKSVLNDLNITYYFGDPTEILLRHVFQELTLNCDVVEVDSILEVYREEAEAVESTKNKMQIIAEKIISVSAIIFFFLVAAVTIGLLGLLYYYSFDLIGSAPIQYLPILFFGPALICKVAMYVFPHIIDATINTSKFMKEGSTLLESVRRARELQQAESLWVNQIMVLKVSPGAA